MSAAAGVVASVITSYVTAQLTARREARKWRRELTAKYAEFAAENPAKAQALARQYGIGVLVVNQADGQMRDKYFVQPNTRLTVGSHPSNDVFVADDAFLSKRHFAIAADDDDVYVEDLGSANGTFVNDVRVGGRVRLSAGDVIRADLPQSSSSRWSRITRSNWSASPNTVAVPYGG